MYNIKGASKTVCKSAKKGISKNIENFHNMAKNIKPLDANDNETISEAKLVFRKNLRRLPNRRREEEITPQHEELIKYVNDSWLLLSKGTEEECTPSTSSGSHSGNHSLLYYEDDPCPPLKDFKPFELELWWGRRLFNLLTKSETAKKM